MGGVSCAANGCSNNRSKKKPGVTFHRFPKDPVRRARWLKVMHKAEWQPKYFHKICSEHFEEKMFNKTGQIVRLRDDAEPTIFPGLPSYLQMKAELERKPPMLREPLTKKRRTEEEVPLSPSSSCGSTSLSTPCLAEEIKLEIEDEDIPPNSSTSSPAHSITEEIVLEVEDENTPATSNSERISSPIPPVTEEIVLEVEDENPPATSNSERISSPIPPVTEEIVLEVEDENTPATSNSERISSPIPPVTEEIVLEVEDENPPATSNSERISSPIPPVTEEIVLEVEDENPPATSNSKRISSPIPPVTEEIVLEVEDENPPATSNSERISSPIPPVTEVIKLEIEDAYPPPTSGTSSSASSVTEDAAAPPISSTSSPTLRPCSPTKEQLKKMLEKSILQNLKRRKKIKTLQQCCRRLQAKVTRLEIRLECVVKQNVMKYRPDLLIS
ncbi:flocculation protein FLO11 isoform X1 [Nilaparvata lugens]|uniref:flocculation protein FLO11 isoform X1 n=1 Tax=Nilaparvata lugens TaxID=108931 RepID=UPI00193CC961|nr:flocculation protein FLO11 isoform X1 [Nilaparvata lugens]